MNKRLARIGRVTVGTLLVLGLTLGTLRAMPGLRLAGQATVSDVLPQDDLSPCARIPELFPLPGDAGYADSAANQSSPRFTEILQDPTLNPVERMSKLYDAHVEAVLDAHTDESSEPVQCGTDPHREASEALIEIASHMKPWKPDGDATADDGTLPPVTDLGALSDLRASDMATVLLEYLHQYKCALTQRKDVLYYLVASDAAAVPETGVTYFGSNPREGGVGLSQVPLLSEYTKEEAAIFSDLRDADPVLRRTLQYLSARDRLAPIGTNLACFERASLQIRDILSLAAEAASRLPEIWGAKDPFRDLTP